MDKKDKKPGGKSAKPAAKKAKPVPKGSIRTEGKPARSGSGGPGKKAIDPKKDFFVEDKSDGQEEVEYVEETEIEFIEETPTIEDISTMDGQDDDDDDEFFGDEDY